VKEPDPLDPGRHAGPLDPAVIGAPAASAPDLEHRPPLFDDLPDVGFLDNGSASVVGFVAHGDDGHPTVARPERRKVEESGEQEGAWKVTIGLTPQPDNHWIKLWQELLQQAEGASEPLILTQASGGTWRGARGDVESGGEFVVEFAAPNEKIDDHIRFIDQLLEQTNKRREQLEVDIEKARAAGAEQQAEVERERADIQRRIDLL
jgi:hypothetical protein